LTPDDQVTGIGKFCNPAIPVPASFAGKQGYIQVIADSPDGILYQCGAVNFVTGANTGTTDNGCANATVSASFVNDTLFANLNGNLSSVPASSSSASSSASPTATKNAAIGQFSPINVGVLGSIAWIALVTVTTGAISLL
jgi:hypothetical protein